MSVEEVGAITTVFYRLVLAAFFLIFLMRYRNQKLDFRFHAIKYYALLGFLGQALPFVLISYAEIYIDS